MDWRIDPITPRPPRADPVAPVRRSDGSTEKRDRDGAPPRRRKPPPQPPEPPPDDGRPHVDVRV